MNLIAQLGTAMAALAAGILLPLAACAAPFPEKPIHFVVPNSPGTATDQLARTVAATVQQRGGQPVVVDNKAGANGIIASDFVAKAPPDGYTVLIGNVTTNAANPSLYKRLPFDPQTDLEPITLIANTPTVLAVPLSLPVNSLPEFIA